MFLVSFFPFFAFIALPPFRFLQYVNHQLTNATKATMYRLYSNLEILRLFLSDEMREKYCSF